MKKETCSKFLKNSGLDYLSASDVSRMTIDKKLYDDISAVFSNLHDSKAYNGLDTGSITLGRGKINFKTKSGERVNLIFDIVRDEIKCIITSTSDAISISMSGLDTIEQLVSKVEEIVDELVSKIPKIA